MIAPCLAAIAATPNGAPYSALPDLVIRTESRIESESGPEGVESFRRAVLLAILEKLRVASPEHALTDEIAVLRRASLQRMRRNCEEHKGLLYAANRDLYCKDLAIVRGKMFPVGARLAETDSGLPRRLLATQGPAQMIRYALLLLAMQGKAPLYQLHVHLEELTEFTEAGWARTLGRLTRMLQLHPEIKGVFGGAWLYDPELPKTSPRLAYIRRIASDAGARYFYSDVDTSGSALSKSPTRRKLFELGKYVPKIYYVIWSRERLIQRAAAW